MNQLLTKAISEINKTISMDWSAASIPYFGRAFLYILMSLAVEARVHNSFYIPRRNVDNYDEEIDDLLLFTAEE